MRLIRQLHVTLLLFATLSHHLASSSARAQSQGDFSRGVNLSSCFEPNATASLLPVTYIEGHGMCPLGFYCPNSYINDSRTYPAVCPPSASCVFKRRNEQVCDAQGVYEPIVCPEGRFCPTGREQYECPKGYFCPTGTRFAYECNGLSLCPAGSFKEVFLGSLLIVVLVDAVVVALFVVESRLRAAPSTLADTPDSNGDVAKPQEMQQQQDEAAVNPDEKVAAVTAAALVSEALGGSTTESAHVEFKNLEVRLPEDHPTGPGKALLQRVSGRFEAGKVTAIMGPSGAGKTVLFTTILGKQPGDWCVEGSMEVSGGRTSMAELKPMIGFVAQDDVLRPELTVLENVLYSSETRLPAEWDKERRSQLRAAVLRALGLEHVRDVAIGDATTRGVSGGQRKRASIAMELACAPAALFLDEPTTGLDAATALELVRLLKIVAQAANIPIAMVIHQPRVEIWEELDQVLLLAPGGRTVFEGPLATVVPALQADKPVGGDADFEHGNPSDAVMDCITAHGAFLADLWETRGRTEEDSHEPVAVNSAHDAKPTSIVVKEGENRPAPTRTTAPWYKQIALAHVREIVGQLRRPQLFIYDLILCVIGGVLLTSAGVDARFVGSLKPPYIVLSPRTDIQEPTMLLMLWGIALSATIGPAGARTVGEYKSMYWREAAAGHSKLAYYIGAATSTLYRTTLTTLHFTTVVYLMYQPLMSFGQVFLLVWLLALALDAQSVLVGALVPIESAPLLSMILCVAAALMNGFAQVPGSVAAYSFQLTELMYTYEVDKVAHVFTTDRLTSFWGYELNRTGLNFAVWGLQTAVFHILAFFFLTMLNRDKQR